jgi:DNA-binding IclR family transcriptional regulator
MTINSVDKAITILDCFSLEEPVLGVGAISRSTGYSASTVSRLLSTMEKRGVVQKARGYGRYQLGYRITLWGQLSQARNNLATVARPTMEALRERRGEEVSLYIAVEDHRTCLARVASKYAIAMTGSIGGRLPLHAGASGRVLLAFMPEERRRRIIAAGRLASFTPNTLTDPVRLNTALRRIRRQGYAISREEREPGAYSIVAPIRQAGGRVVASLCLAGPLYRLDENAIDLWVADVCAAAARISDAIGHRETPST